MMGAFSILLLYFIAHYFIKKENRFNLHFALGCLVSIFRSHKNALYKITQKTDALYQWLVRLDYLSFIWGPLFYILLAKTLFPKFAKKNFIRGLVILAAAQSVYILILHPKNYALSSLHDLFIITCALYALLIYFRALINKMNFAVPIFVVNLLFVLGVTHDVLAGSYIIDSPFSEVFSYLFFLYVCTMAVVLILKSDLMEKEYLRSQLNFLHAQIKPHFLYNTISTIRAYSKSDPEKTAQMLDYLSVYLRGKLKNGEDVFTSLKEEMELVKAYLSLEKVRFEERLEVEYDIDDDIDVIIPCLLIQPVVENAVKHGLSKKAEGGKIKITIKKNEGEVSVTIHDNGVGIDEKKLSGILDGSKVGIGLSNTNERLNHHYNTQIEAESKKGEGTTVKLTIPIGRRAK
jgi:hypothetical protein